MYITGFTDKLIELNWPKRVTVKPATFWQLKDASASALQVIEVDKGKAELSFMCEVTKVCLEGYVDRPDTADLTTWEIPQPALSQLPPPAIETTETTGDSKKE